jgi:hypothetical protein
LCRTALLYLGQVAVVNGNNVLNWPTWLNKGVLNQPTWLSKGQINKKSNQNFDRSELQQNHETSGSPQGEGLRNTAIWK